MELGLVQLESYEMVPNPLLVLNAQRVVLLANGSWCSLVGDFETRALGLPLVKVLDVVAHRGDALRVRPRPQHEN